MHPLKVQNGSKHTALQHTRIDCVPLEWCAYNWSRGGHLRELLFSLVALSAGNSVSRRCDARSEHTSLANYRSSLMSQLGIPPPASSRAVERHCLDQHTHTHTSTHYSRWFGVENADYSQLRSTVIKNGTEMGCGEKNCRPTPNTIYHFNNIGLLMQVPDVTGKHFAKNILSRRSEGERDQRIWSNHGGFRHKNRVKTVLTNSSFRNTVGVKSNDGVWCASLILEQHLNPSIEDCNGKSWQIVVIHSKYCDLFKFIPPRHVLEQLSTVDDVITRFHQWDI